MIIKATMHNNPGFPRSIFRPDHPPWWSSLIQHCWGSLSVHSLACPESGDTGFWWGWGMWWLGMIMGMGLAQHMDLKMRCPFPCQNCNSKTQKRAPHFGTAPYVLVFIHKRDEHIYLKGLCIMFSLKCYWHVPNISQLNNIHHLKGLRLQWLTPEILDVAPFWA